jgi:hypothetical protein
MGHSSKLAGMVMHGRVVGFPTVGRNALVLPDISVNRLEDRAEILIGGPVGTEILSVIHVGKVLDESSSGMNILLNGVRLDTLAIDRVTRVEMDSAHSKLPLRPLDHQSGRPF